MNIDTYYFKAVNNAVGCMRKTQKQRADIIKRVRKDFEKSLDVDEFSFWQEGRITTKTVLLNVYKKKYSSVDGQLQEFTTLMDSPVEVGDLLYNPTEKIYWLCIYAAQQDYIYCSGKLLRCNSFLRWQDELGRIWEYPVCDADTTYNSGIDENRQMTWGTSQHQLTTVSDLNTTILKNDKRFFVDKNINNPKTYKLTQNDTTSHNYDKGLVKLKVLEDQYNPNMDNIEHWICDYQQIPEPIGITILYSSLKIREGGTARHFEADTENEIETWRLDAIPEISQYLVLTIDSENSRKCAVNCLGNTRIVGSKFILQCIDVYGSMGEIELTISGGI